MPLAEKQDFASTIAVILIFYFFFTIYEYVDFFFLFAFLNFFLIKLYFFSLKIREHSLFGI